MLAFYRRFHMDGFGVNQALARLPAARIDWLHVRESKNAQIPSGVLFLFDSEL
jgi:hypothetical protein